MIVGGRGKESKGKGFQGERLGEKVRKRMSEGIRVVA